MQPGVTIDAVTSGGIQGIPLFLSLLIMKYNLNTKDEGVRDMLIDKYEQLGMKKFKEEYGIDGSEIRRWRQLKIATGSSAPKYTHLGGPSKVTKADVKKIEEYLKKRPFATNADLAAQVKNKITPRHAGRIIEASPLKFTKKLEQEDIEASFTADNFEKGRKFMNTNKNVRLDKRVYVDETRISSKVRRRYGRFPKGVAPWTPRNEKYPGHTVVCAIKDGRWLHPAKVYNKRSITTREFEVYVDNDLAPLLENDDVVYWDRWGRSGRAKNPVAHHFSPTARASVEGAGAKLRLLPPTGKLLNPIEPLFGDTKRIYDKKLGALEVKMEPSKIPFEKKVQIWHEAENAVSPQSFKRAYAERANGKEFLRVSHEKGLL